MVRTATIVLLLLLPMAALAKAYPLCPGYVIEAPRPIAWNPNEKKLVCGDDKTESWTRIPVAQARFHLQAFLQDRGYFSPQVYPSATGVTVDVGRQSIARRIEVTGAPAFFHLHRRRQTIGRILTPAFLSEVERWSIAELQAHGYPCPTVTSRADAASGAIRLAITPGERQRLTTVTEEPIPGLHARVLRRYDAFRLGDWYDQRLLSVTADRIVTEGLLQSTHFVTQCRPEGTAVHQKSIAGKPRLIVVGFGANTEEYALAKASWRSSRYGTRGSSLLVALFGSFKRQELMTEGKWYLWRRPARWYFNPLAVVRHEEEPQYEFITGTLRLTPAFTWDNQYLGLKARFGPALKYARTFKGAAEELTHFLSLRGEVELTSHNFELYRADPHEGFTLSFSTDLHHRRLYSSVTAQRLIVQGTALWNVGYRDPPLLVLGVRGGAATTIADRGSPSFDRLPPDFRYYLGGSKTLRGFGRLELPTSGNGALTMAFASVEGRSTKVMPLDIQPICFADIGATGVTAAHLDSRAYLSLGGGFRWPSPIGVFRATAAHGFVIGDAPASPTPSHWQFFFSFGEEF